MERERDEWLDGRMDGLSEGGREGLPDGWTDTNISGCRARWMLRMGDRRMEAWIDG
jgi:hypothetical protein